MKINTEQALEFIPEIFQAGIVPFVVGSPGTAKSSVFKQIAENYKLKVIDVRLSQADPVDLNGLPGIVDGKATFNPMDTFPIEGDEIPKGYDGFLLLLDELNSAPLSVQAAAYKLILDREVGQHKLHPKVVIGAAGNLSTDRAIVNRMSTAMQSRMAHFELVTDHEAWQKWAIQNQLDHRVVSFIGFKPEILNAFKPNHAGSTYPCQRTWEFMSNIIKKYPKEIPSNKMPLLASVVEEPAAREFHAYSKIFETLATIEEIKANPEGIAIPSDLGTQYAIAGSIGQHMNKTNMPALSRFLNRMGIEFQIMAYRQVIVKDKSTMQSPTIQEWLNKNLSELF